MVEAVPLDVAPDGQTLFRTAKIVPFKQPHNFNVVGAFDITQLRDPYSTALNAVPMETYHPPTLVRRYDEAGNPTAPVTLLPTLNEQGYLSRPPYALTTLEGACFYTGGDDCISAIRVRVAGIETLNEQSWQRIEAVAEQIRQRTGLQVDVTLGSSPTPVLVHLPGYDDAPAIGYVEAPWVKKGVQITIHRGFNRADLFLFSIFFAISTLHIFSLTLVSTLSRVRHFGLLRALGWRNRTVAGLVVGEALLLACLAIGLSMLLSAGAIRLFDLAVPVARTLLIIPLALLLFLLGSLYPAWWATRISPIAAIQGGEVQARAIRFGGYALKSALRRPLRTLLTLLTTALATGLFIFLLLVQVELNGLLTGTFLGEHLALQLQGYHWVLTALGVALAGLAVAEVMFLNVQERRQELGMLKALGWRNATLFRTIMMEAVSLGLVGGAAGVVAGAGLFGLLYQRLPASLLWLGLLGVVLCAAVSALAALLPALRAARLNPTEVTRHDE